MGLAFGLVIAAGLSTTIGGCFVFCSSYANTKALAAALGVSAGVMLYVSFVEIFAIKAVEGFSVQYPEHGSKYATLCFFCGIVFTMFLDALVHQIGHWQLTRRKNEDGKEKNAESASRTRADPSNMLTGERAWWKATPLWRRTRWPAEESPTPKDVGRGARPDRARRAPPAAAEPLCVSRTMRRTSRPRARACPGRDRAAATSLLRLSCWRL